MYSFYCFLINISLTSFLFFRYLGIIYPVISNFITSEMFQFYIGLTKSRLIILTVGLFISVLVSFYIPYFLSDEVDNVLFLLLFHFGIVFLFELKSPRNIFSLLRAICSFLISNRSFILVVKKIESVVELKNVQFLNEIEKTITQQDIFQVEKKINSGIDKIDELVVQHRDINEQFKNLNNKLDQFTEVDKLTKTTIEEGLGNLAEKFDTQFEESKVTKNFVEKGFNILVEKLNSQHEENKNNFLQINITAPDFKINIIRGCGDIFKNLEKDQIDLLVSQSNVTFDNEESKENLFYLNQAIEIKWNSILVKLSKKGSPKRDLIELLVKIFDVETNWNSVKVEIKNGNIVEFFNTYLTIRSYDGKKSEIHLNDFSRYFDFRDNNSK